jgi:hypothetical protein
MIELEKHVGQDPILQENDELRNQNEESVRKL